MLQSRHQYEILYRINDDVVQESFCAATDFDAKLFAESMAKKKEAQSYTLYGVVIVSTVLFDSRK